MTLPESCRLFSLSGWRNFFNRLYEDFCIGANSGGEEGGAGR